MKVLIVSTNTLPASPSGPAYVAGAVRQAGHQVAVYESLFAADLGRELKAALDDFQPEVVGVSIRLVHGDVTAAATAPAGAPEAAAALGTHYVDLRPRVKEIVDIIRQHSGARLVLGGPGFNYYAQDWLEYLGVTYGLRGEGEAAFPLFLDRLEHGGDLYAVPGCVYREGAEVRSQPPEPVADLDGAALPAYDLLDLAEYAQRNILPALFTKRGCAFSCTYCPYSKLEGKRYRLKSPERVLAEIRHTVERAPARRVMLCDNNFNAPPAHAAALCRAFASAPFDFSWGTGDLKPVGLTAEFCRLLEDSRCFYANLAVESASDAMLKRMQRGYTVRQVRQSLEALSRSKIPFGASLMLGAPGETPETIAETLQVMGDYPPPLGIWVTVGVYMWTDLQDLVAEARQTGYLKEDTPLFSGPVYLSPQLPLDYVVDLVHTLRARPGYSVQVNRADLLWPKLSGRAD